jgi:hypothetical protein
MTRLLPRLLPRLLRVNVATLTLVRAVPPLAGLCRGLWLDVAKAADESHFFFVNALLFMWHRLQCLPRTGDLGPARAMASEYWKYALLGWSPVYWLFWLTIFPFKLIGRWVVRLCSCNVHPPLIDSAFQEYYAASFRLGMLAVEVSTFWLLPFISFFIVIHPRITQSAQIPTWRPVPRSSCDNPSDQSQLTVCSALCGHCSSSLPSL